MKASHLALLLAAGLGGCAHASRSTSPSTPPAMVLGEFVDDYGHRFTISASVFFQHPRARYRVLKWNPTAEYLIARNDSANPGEKGLFTRIDWLPLPGMPPYTWGFCLSAWDAPTAEAAEATVVAQRATPRTGCNGFPFSRMRPATPTDTMP